MIESRIPSGTEYHSPDVVADVLVETTGKFVVVFDESVTDPAAFLASVAGLHNVASSADFGQQAVDFDETAQSDAVVFSQLGVAVVSDQTELAALQTSMEAQGRILSVSPELRYHVLTEPGGYLQGYRDGVADLSGRLGAVDSPGSGANRPPAARAPFADTGQLTWGLQATGVATSPRSGAGIRVAILDTGFDATHPDFVGRSVMSQSFVQNQTPQDGHGHGTHCVGTSCGPKSPPNGPRYGVAHEAEILVGKVLSNAGSGSDSGIIAGINWAVTEGCPVISMSLGADVAQVHPPYVVVGQRALDAGSLIVAAAGNNADRRVANFGFVGPPANSPAIMAVGALDQTLGLAYFSARSLAVRGGQVDIAGPGWQVYSSWMMPTRYRTISGTSMATPHVAGIAALWAEQTGYRGRELWATLAQESTRLLAPSVDVGGGLVQAPQ